MSPGPTMQQSSASASASLALLIFGIAFAAFCVWLTVRIVNRRERWAKWMLAGVVALPILYVASFGPVCWITSRANVECHALGVCYQPLASAMWRIESWGATLDAYSRLYAAPNWVWTRIDSQYGTAYFWSLHWSVREKLQHHPEEPSG